MNPISWRASSASKLLPVESTWVTAVKSSAILSLPIINSSLRADLFNSSTQADTKRPSTLRVVNSGCVLTVILSMAFEFALRLVHAARQIPETGNPLYYGHVLRFAESATSGMTGGSDEIS